MDVFELRDRVTEDYARYMRSFIEIRDARVHAHVEDKLPDLWPDPLIQLNPAFEPGATMEAQIAEGLLHPTCREIFARKNEGEPPQPLQLYRHQIEGIRAARAGDNYVLTTGTGSGKSLSYIVPIVDHVLRTPRSERRGIQAIVVYPMNALANSQLGELRKYLEFGFERPLVTFERYTGQDRLEKRREIAESPPDILLTNYVMLELILTRIEERPLIAAAQGLRFLVFDELHTYRGRQGADVALLCRRVREVCRATRLIHVGTSATLSSEGTWRKQQKAVASVASQIFGVPVEPRRIIGETLRRVTPELDIDDQHNVERLAARIGTAPPESTPEFIADPLASWIESNLGLRLRDGRLVRQPPRTLKAAAGDLAALTERPHEACERALRAALLAGYRHQHDGRPLFAFRLHQFIAKGDTVYAGLASPAERYLTTQPQRFVPDAGHDEILLPLCFCRECGQDFYSVRRGSADDGTIVYRPRQVADTLGSEEGEAGFLYLSDERPWPHDAAGVIAAIPESWIEERRGKLAVRRTRKDRLPLPITISRKGVEGHGDLEVAYFRAPFLLCPACGVAYDSRQRSDFGKLGTLGSEGRSTATTVLSLSALRRLRGLGSLKREARKLLSFTDNRQDAALQAGHFNDFVNLGIVRSGLYRALAERGDAGIDHDALTQAVFDALDLPMGLYAANPEVLYGQRERTQKALRRVLGYCLYRDLARGWRLTSPNLEQAGLLRVEYRDLARLCDDPKPWAACHTTLKAATSALRQEIATTLLNYLRRELVIFVDYLDPAHQEQIRLDANQLLVDPWMLGDNDQLTQSFVAILGSGGRKSRGKPFAGGRFIFVSPRGGFGQYLRRREVLGGGTKISLDDTQVIIEDLVGALVDLGVLRKIEVGRRGGKAIGYQISAATMIWRVGDAERAAHDPIRVPQTPADGLRPNDFFRDFYRGDARDLASFKAHEHTAQVRADVREDREERFRSAELPLLFCSPTMELGVDIAELNVVNMRNVPPTPANYAQRSGRAGRSGQPAFVYTYCTAHSPHDHYFFRHPEQMVSGEVTEPRLDLANEDLLRAHVHAIWLAESGLQLGSSLSSLLDVAGDEPTVDPTSECAAKLNDKHAQARALARARSALGEEIRSLHEEDQGAAESWLASTLRSIPQSFVTACKRWRELFLAAKTQARLQHQIYGDLSRPPTEREQARRLRLEAESQLKLLVDRGEGLRSDFYPYRYFASEGFLPGYNFPRLPLSAYLPRNRRRSRDDDDFLSRPRFLAISEFGPRSIIYHEGARYVINKVILGASAEKRGSEDGLLTRAVRCESCGAIEPLLGEGAPDLCRECNAPLGSPTPNFFRMRNVTARRRDRITSDEEERLRVGYDLRTSVHFPLVDGRPRRQRAEFVDADGELLATLSYGHGANLWRINLGWRRRSETDPPGFLLDTERGIWVKSQNPEAPDDDSEDPATPQQERVIPFVKDTRNCLLIEPATQLPQEAMASLQAALKTAIQLEFQLEDRELAAEPLPSKSERRHILLYEAAEGGAGVLRHLLHDPEAIRRVAKRALALCHFNPDTGDDLGSAAPNRERCVAACYDCLLSYFNQPDHPIVDRHLLPPLLLSWAGGKVHPSGGETPRDNHLEELLRKCDSELERRFLLLLAERGHALPGRAQVFLAEANTRVDFFYAPEHAGATAVFIDGPPHDNQDAARRDILIQDQLEEVGYQVLRFHHRDRWEEIIARNPSIFGPGSERPTQVQRAAILPPFDSLTNEDHALTTDADVPAPAAELSDDDALTELLDLFDEAWHRAIRAIARHPDLVVDAGGELGDRVSAQFHARVDRGDSTLYVVDADDPDAAAALRILHARGDSALVLAASHTDPVSAVLDALNPQ